MVNLAELQHTICEEKERHRLTMDRLAGQRATLCSILEDQQQSFQELITRVTQLRVAKGEQFAMQTKCSSRTVGFNTGCAAVDHILEDIQKNIKGAFSKGNSLLCKLGDAAKQAVALLASTNLSSPSSSNLVTQRTSLAVVMCRKIRGTDSWAHKHYKKCSACESKRAALQFSEKIDKKAVGMAALPVLSRISGKRFFNGSLCVVKEPLKDRMLEVLRVSLVVGVKSADGGHLADSQGVAKQITEVVMKCVHEEIAALKEAAKKALWNEQATQNMFLSGAADMLLHSLDPRVHVSSTAPGGALLGEDYTPMNVDVVISTPAHLPTITPFITLLRDPSQRAYVMEHIVQPAARRIGALFGMQETIMKYTQVALNAFGALLDITKHEGADKLPRESSTNCKSSSTASQQLGNLSDMHAILLALAMFGTSIEVDCAIPHVCVVNNVVDAKRCLLSVAESFLRLLTAPKPYTVPAANDPMCADFVLRVLQAPTIFLEYLNSSFSSNHRLPRTARIGVVDHLASPKLKIRYALKCFSEILIDFYRPYTQETGVVIADEKSKGVKSKPSRCTPVADLPPDIVRANIEVAQKADSLLRTLQKLQQGVAVETDVERHGKEAINHVLREAKKEKNLSAFLKGIESLRLDVVGLEKVRVDVLLPLGLDLIESRGELLYVRLEGYRHA